MMEYWELVKTGALFLCSVVCFPLFILGYLVTIMAEPIDAIIEDWEW